MKRIALSLAVVVCLAAACSANTLYYGASLSGLNESPPNNSPGTGTALVIIDDVANTMEVEVSFSGLTSGTTASHIHCCTTTAGSGNAGVATTTPTFTGFPLAVTSGTYDHIFDLTLASSYNPAFVTANGNSVSAAELALLAGMAAGKTYLNIHTTNNPGGEIRGFLAPVPEPATMTLMAGGIVGLLGKLRKRKV